MKYKILWFAILAFLVGFIMQAREARSETLPELPDIKLYAAQKVIDKWGGGQYTYFDEIVDRESDYLHTAQNPKSTAYGIGQFLDSTWESVGCVKTSDPYKQVDCMVAYIDLRYETPKKAKLFHDRKGWY